MTIIDAELPSCEKCGKPFSPRSGSGGSVQRFCCAGCRLTFHKERQRSQRIGLYAGQSPQPCTQQPATLLEQAERLIASLPLDQRRRLIARLVANMPPDKSETEPALPLGLTAAGPLLAPPSAVQPQPQSQPEPQPQSQLPQPRRQGVPRKSDDDRVTP